jgi:hypothetical protein
MSTISGTNVGRHRPGTARAAAVSRAATVTAQPAAGAAMRPATARAGALGRATPRLGEAGRIAELERQVREERGLLPDAAAELACLREARASAPTSRQWSRVSSTTGLKLSPRWAALEYETIPSPRRVQPPKDEPGPGYYSPRTGFDTPHCKSQLALSHVSLKGRHWQAMPASQNGTPGPASCAASPHASPHRLAHTLAEQRKRCAFASRAPSSHKVWVASALAALLCPLHVCCRPCRYTPIIAKDIRAGQSQLPRMGAYGTLPGQPMPKRRGPVVLTPRPGGRAIATWGSK